MEESWKKLLDLNLNPNKHTFGYLKNNNDKDKKSKRHKKVCPQKKT